MADILGFDVPLPKIEIGGFLSNSWVYILIIAIIGLILIVTLVLVLFYKTYRKKVIIFENISGQGFQPLIRTRARIVRVGGAGEEIMKTLAGGRYLTAYGRKMGKHSYWFAKGQDGYLYNVVLGDLDAKMGMLDIEPVDRDVRMFHVALDRLSQSTYGKQSFMEKYGSQMIMFLFLIVLVVGMWMIIGKIGDATQSLSLTAETNRDVLQALGGVLQKTDNIQSGIEGGVSGLVPAT